MARRRRRSEDFMMGYTLVLAHAVILLHRAGWGRKKRLPKFAESMIDELLDWQAGGHGYKESVALLEQLTGIKIEK